jgi:EmrB/QacA subfamily drug resistance transporter
MTPSTGPLTSESPYPSSRVRRYLPWLVAIALFMENLDATIVNTAVPTMSEQLGVQPLSLKSVLTSYTLSLAVFIPLSGWMADRYGTRRVFAWAITLFMIGSLLCGLSTTIPVLVGSRIAQGMGGAMMTPVGRLTLVRAFPRSEMIATLNYVLIPALIGPLIGPFAGGLIVHWLSWRYIFLINIPFALLGLALVKGFMPDYREPAAPALDGRGFVLFGAGTGLLSYVLEVFGEHRLGGAWIGLLLVASGIFLAAYGWHARRVPAPVLDLGLLRVRTLRVGVLGGFITRLGVGGMPFLLPLLYQLGMGFPAWQSGLLMIPQAAAAISMRMLNQPLLARFGHRRVLLANTVLLGINLMGFAWIGPRTPLWLIVGLSFIQGFLSSLQFTSANTLVYANVDDHQASKASSISATAQQMSLSFGVATASLLTAWYLGPREPADPVQIVAALHRAFLTLGAFTLLSSAVFATLRRDDGKSVSHYDSETNLHFPPSKDPSPPSEGAPMPRSAPT